MYRFPKEEVKIMAEKDLRKLSRLDLLDMLIELSAELQNVKAKLAQAEAKLQEREIAIDEAGSIAEAALQINDVYAVTDAACRQYVENVRLLSERQERICAQRDRESKIRAEQMLAQTQKTCEDMEKNTKILCDRMVREAKTESARCWMELEEKLDTYCAQHEGLQKLLSVVMSRKEQ